MMKRLPLTRFTDEVDRIKTTFESIEAIRAQLPETAHDEFAEVLRTVSGMDRHGRSYDPDKHLIGRAAITQWLSTHRYFTR